MKVIRVHQFGDPDVLKLENSPEPAPGAGQVLVAMKAAGVNPVDTYIRSGIYGARPLPYVPGTDGAGVIEAAGSGVTRYRVGDRVYIYGNVGTYAEKVVAATSQVFPLPDKASFSQGAAIGVPYATAYYALFARGEAREGETVLIHGASGGVGTAAVQLAFAHGLTVIGTAGTEKGRVLVRDQGAHYVLDHHAKDFDQQLSAATQGKGVDVIIEMLSNVNLGKDLKYLAPHGRVVTVGSRGKAEIDPRDLFLKQTDIRGTSLMTVPEPDLAGIHAAIVAGLGNGVLRPVIGQEIPLADAAKAHRAVMEAGAYGKIVLTP